MATGGIPYYGRSRLECEAAVPGLVAGLVASLAAASRLETVVRS